MTAEQTMELADEIERSDGIYLMHSTKEVPRGYQLGITKTAQVVAALRGVGGNAREVIAWKHPAYGWLTDNPNKPADWRESGYEAIPLYDAEGNLAATARDGRVYSEQFDEYRRAKSDPYEPNAAFIVKAVNNHDALVKALSESRAALIAFKDAVEASQKMNGREYVGLGIRINDAIGHAWNALAAVGTSGGQP